MDEQTAKKTIGYGISAISFGVIAVLTGFSLPVPDWISPVATALSIASNAIGIKIVLPSASTERKKFLKKD